MANNIINITQEVKQVCDYGTYKPKYFYQVDNGFFRYDEYTNHLSGEVSGDNVKVASKTDLSPIVIGRGNSELCHCCFAGYPHSVNSCQQSQDFLKAN